MKLQWPVLARPALLLLNPRASSVPKYEDPHRNQPQGDDGRRSNPQRCCDPYRLTNVGLDHARYRSAGAAYRRGPPEPARVRIAEGHRESVEDEGKAGKDEIQRAEESEIDRVLCPEGPDGARAKVRRRRQPSLGEMLGGEAVQCDENHPNGGAHDRRG